MCGIAGFFGNEIWEEKIEAMNRRMVHRGPNAQEYWHDGNDQITLGHVRLSIMDLSDAGKQPMISHSGECLFVFNGEIYNHGDLKKRLIDDGKCDYFYGHSDTEIILEYICEYGIERALDDCVGMFAFALYNRKTKELFLARDRMGEKPLYYGFVEGNFCFASDIGAIDDAYKSLLNIDREALTLYLTYGYIPAPYSIYSKIKKLPPGSLAMLKDNCEESFCIKQYWSIKNIVKFALDNPFNGSYNEAVDRLNYLLHQSVKRQMVADVPVGAFLSGGIDSSVVVSVMQELSERPIETFTIGFNEKSYNEACFSKEIADLLGTNHNEWYINPKDAMNTIMKLPHIYSEPFADESQIATFLVSWMAKKKVSVSLSGDAGDELFCGYNSYFLISEYYKKLNYIPLDIRKKAEKLLHNFPDTGLKRFEQIRELIGATSIENFYMKAGSNVSWAKKVMGRSVLPDFYYNQYENGFVRTSEVQNLMLMDTMMYLPDDILVKVDRASMAVSLESRIPLLDRDIIEFAWSLPIAFNKDKNIGKKVLREVLYKYIPKEMMDRPKKGFSVPIAHWIRNSYLHEWAEDLLQEDKIRNEGILDYKVVSKTWNCFIKTGFGISRVWNLLMFEEWLQSKG